MIGRGILADHAAGADGGALTDTDRRNQSGIGADKSLCTNLGTVLVDAIIVAGDGAGAQVGPFTDQCITDITEVTGLGAGLEAGLLDLNEIADPDAC